MSPTQVSQEDRAERIGEQWERRERGLDRKFLAVFGTTILLMAGFVAVCIHFLRKLPQATYQAATVTTISNVTTKQTLASLTWSINGMRTNDGQYPTTVPNSLRKSFIDEWGRPLNYEWPPSLDSGQFKYKPAIWSNGPDGINQRGGGDDIGNWIYKPIEDSDESSPTDPPMDRGTSTDETSDDASAAESNDSEK